MTAEPEPIQLAVLADDGNPHEPEPLALTASEKAAAFDLISTALLREWPDGTWTISNVRLIDLWSDWMRQPAHRPSRDAAMADLIAWAADVAARK